MYTCFRLLRIPNNSTPQTSTDRAGGEGRPEPENGDGAVRLRLAPV